MDVKCGHCLEPWDVTSTYARFRKCEGCDGTGAVDCEERLSDAAPGEMDLVCQDAEATNEGDCETCSACVGCSCPGEECEGCAHGYCPSSKCDECDNDDCIDGTIYRQETCECGEEILNCWHTATAVIGDGFLMCLRCARRNGWLTEEKPCESCSGTGKEAEVTDIGDHDAIARFNAGIGCPRCEFGALSEMKCDECDRIEFGWEGRPCFDNRVLKSCAGSLRPHSSHFISESAQLRTLRDLLGDDNDGLASDIENFGI